METHPVWAAIVWVATLFGVPNLESHMTGIPTVPPALPDLISCTPDPPQKGQDVKICFKFGSGTTSPVSLTVEFSTPNGVVSQVVQVSESAPCVTVSVPSDATDMLVVDQSGTSAAFGRVIAP